VDAVVLAAGKSTRMGQQKLLMPYKKSTIIKTIVNELESSLSNQTIVVTGSHREEIQEELKECKLSFVNNENFESGMLSSVQKGMEALSDKVDGAMILLGDQPMVSRKVIDRLISVFQKTEKGLLVPTFQNKRGHPVLIASKYREQIKSINPEIGLRELFLNNQDDILEVEMNTNDILKDLDTPEDYRNETGTAN
jgi:molybdenum cofactor cytidylyltransferase